MIGLLCFVVAVLASPFKSKIRLEAENAALRHGGLAAQAESMELSSRADCVDHGEDGEGHDIEVREWQVEQRKAAHPVKPECARPLDNRHTHSAISVIGKPGGLAAPASIRHS